MSASITKAFQSIVEQLRKGASDYKGLAQQLIDIGVDEQSARILVNRAVDQVETERKQGDA